MHEIFIIFPEADFVDDDQICQWYQEASTMASININHLGARTVEDKALALQASGHIKLGRMQ